jgi:phosphoglycerate dehydrogenase-like enzyme
MDSAMGPAGPGVVIYRPVDVSGASHGRLTAAGCRLAVAREDEALDTALNLLAPVNAVMAASIRGARLDRQRIAALPALRIIAKYTIGTDDIDVAAATEQGVLVTHCPTEANYGGVAEGTIAMMLALLKQLAARDRLVRSGGWRDPSLEGVYLGAREDGYAGISLGIVGLGRIGRRVAELIAPWKVSVLAADPYIDAEVFARYGAERLALAALLQRADVVSLHCQLTEETTGMIGARELALMKPGSILLNTARGRIVDIDAVCDALDSGRLGGAAFDVLPQEPPPRDSRILKSDERVILSPHMVAANHGGTLAAAIPWATEAVLDALAGRVPAHVYNEAAVGRWRERFAGRSLLAPEHARAG